MRKALTVVLVGMVILLAGCTLSLFDLVVPSLHPFYTAKDLIFDPALVGSWEQQQKEGKAPSAKPSQVWVFKRSESTEEGEANAYDLTVNVVDYAASFSAHLAKAGDAVFLDLLPADFKTPQFKPGANESGSPAEEAGDDVMILYFLHWVPAHSVWRVRLNGDELRLDALGDDWVAEQVREKKLGIRCEDVSGERGESGGRVLTASPEELREFLLKHAHDDKAFVSRWTYKRQKPAPPEPKKEEPAPAK